MVGAMSNVPTVLEYSAASGNITFIGNAVVAGGLAGRIQGFTNSTGSKIRLTASHYTGGLVTVFSTTGNVLLGGVAGDISNATLYDCYSAAQGLTLKKTSTGSTHFGGFTGNIGMGVDLIRCYSLNSVTADNGSGATGSIYIGGFAGQLAGTSEYDPESGEPIYYPVSLEGCYAEGAVTSVSYSTQVSGGLIGYSFMNYSLEPETNNTISRCYATGAVSADNRSALAESSTGGLVGSATSTDISECYATGAVNARQEEGNALAGGLVGNLTYGDITDCYALGAVLADNQSGGVLAGGLAGRLMGDPLRGSASITKSFAAGAVRAQSPHSSAVLYAGGILGYVVGSPTITTLSQTAALGPSVTVTGSYTETRSARRIYGNSNLTTFTTDTNYAFNEMLIRESTVYDVPGNPITVSPTGADTKHGEDKGAGGFLSQTFWVATLGLATDKWNYSGLVGRGHPILKNVVNPERQ
jgi:hypothetical protein